MLTAVLSGITDVSDATVSETAESSNTSQSQLTATADGGTEIEGLRGQILEALKGKYQGQSVGVSELAGYIEENPERVRDKLEDKLTPDGDVRVTGDGYTLNT